MRVAASVRDLTTTLLQVCATVKRPPANYMRSPNNHNSQQRCSWDHNSVTAPLVITHKQETKLKWSVINLAWSTANITHQKLTEVIFVLIYYRFCTRVKISINTKTANREVKPT